MKEISRRSFLKISAAAAVASSELGCEPSPVAENPPINSPEANRTPAFGDVINIDGHYFLLRSNGKRYSLSDQELEQYRVASKLSEYKRKIFATSGSRAEAYPVGKRSSYPIIINRYTGLPLPNEMGERVMYSAGLLSGETLINTLGNVSPAATFPEITKELAIRGHKDPFALFFTYGQEASNKTAPDVAKNGFGYGWEDTLRPLNELIADSVAHFEDIMENHPLVQINPIGHSLGGFLALRAVMEHPDATNGLILLSSPARGLEKTLLLNALYSSASFLTQRLSLSQEHVKKVLRLADELFALYENKDYQKKLDDFTTSYVASGKKFVVVIDESDPVVSVNSARLKGAIEIRIKSKTDINLLQFLLNSQQISVADILKLVAAHGNSLSDPIVVKRIGELVGKNLSVPLAG